MRAFTKGLAFSTIGLFLSGSAYAVETPTPITSLTCTGGFYANINAAAVYAYSLEAQPTANTKFFTAYLSGAMFRPLLLDAFIGPNFSNCVFANNSEISVGIVKLLNVTSVGVGVNVDAGGLSEDNIKQLFTEVDFQYTDITIGNAPNLRTRPVDTQEEQVKAYQAYKLRSHSLLKP